MITARKKISTLLWSLAFAALMAAAIDAASGTDRPNQPAASVPQVTAVTQVTHDGVSKTNLLSDDSNLYVTEWPAAHHVIAKVSLEGSRRSTIASPFANLQAVDLSPDHSKLLISPIQGGSSDHEFWTLPLKAGSPERVGKLTGRDATWSPDGQNVAFGKDATLYLASPTGTRIRGLYSANGSVFAPRFSPDGRRIRFTVSNTRKIRPLFGRLRAMGRIRMRSSPIGKAQRLHAVAVGPRMAAITYFR